MNGTSVADLCICRKQTKYNNAISFPVVTDSEEIENYNMNSHNRIVVYST